jgi:hypothetical protein
MRSLKRVGTGVPPSTLRNSWSESGTLIESIRFVPISAFANTARAPRRLNTTVFLLRPFLKWRPRIVSFSPTATSSGATRVTTGALRFFFLASAAGANAAASAVTRRATQAAIMATRRGRGRMRARSSIALVIGGRARPLEALRDPDGVSTPPW